MRINNIFPDGQVRILFSEDMLDESDFGNIGLNISSLNVVKNEIL